MKANKNAKKDLGQYLAILTSPLVNNAYIHDQLQHISADAYLVLMKARLRPSHYRSYFKRTSHLTDNIQLFRERLSEELHATILKGIVGGFEFTVLQKSLKVWYGRPWTYVCKCWRKQLETVRQLPCQGQCINHILFYLLGLSRTHFFRQPFSK